LEDVVAPKAKLLGPITGLNGLHGTVWLSMAKTKFVLDMGCAGQILSSVAGG